MSDSEVSDEDGAGPEPSSQHPVGPVRAPRLVVAVGASAGGLESLERLLTHVPDDTGLAFVIVQHLSPHHKTMMVELLARRTDLDVRTAVHGVAVRRDTVHVLPPGKRMTIAKGRLQLDSDIGGEQPNLPIDRFFASLAADAGERAVAIVLSGTGSDGTAGIADIQAEGGLVLAETEVTAAFSGMPDNAVASGHVDYSLAPEEMIEILVEHAGRTVGGSGELIESGDRDTGRVLELLHERHGIDFTRYKAGTIGRRIERRVQLAGGDGALGGYVGRLEDDPDELDLLYHDLLIGVTRFFRDEACFEKLELEVLPRLFRKLDAGAPVPRLVRRLRDRRGALLARDAGARADRGARPADRGEDLRHRPAPRRARARRARRLRQGAARERLGGAAGAAFREAPGRLSASSTPCASTSCSPATTCSPTRRSRRLDLVVCRNLLIYFELPAQSKALRLFHFALAKGRGRRCSGRARRSGRWPIASTRSTSPAGCSGRATTIARRGDFHFEPPKLEDTEHAAPRRRPPRARRAAWTPA